MIESLILAGYLAAYIYVFYLLFVICMGAMNAWRTLTLLAKVLFVPPAVIGLAMDTIFQYTVAMLIFWDRPASHEYTLTVRLGRYKTQVPNTWRGKIASFICGHLLDPFQVGGHCAGYSAQPTIKG